MENKNQLSVMELQVLKGLCVKAMMFELAAKVRDIERAHPEYKEKKKRGRPVLEKNKWRIKTKNFRVESGVPQFDILITPPKNATKKQKELLKKF